MADIVTLPSRSARYDAVARGLHWGMAALILLAFALGLTVDAFPKSWERALVAVHKDIGIGLIVLVVLRLLWRLTHRPPQTVQHSALVGTAAKLGHAGLYVLMALVPVIGVVYSIRRGQSFDFGLFTLQPFQAAEPRTVTRPIREWHEWAAYALIGLAGLHAVAALWHHLIRKDDTLRLMLPKD